MRQDLSRLARELRKETCPRRVLDEVGRRISAETVAVPRWRYAAPVIAAGLILVCGLFLWRWQAGVNARQQAKVAEATALDRAQIASRAAGALELIGRVLVDAGAHSEKVISERAVPPLRNGLETAKNKIIRVEL